MKPGFRQAIINDTQFYHQREAGVGGVGKAGDSKSPRLQQAGQGIWRGNDVARDPHLIVRDQGEAAAEETEHEVGLARTGRPDHKNRLTLTGGATAMHKANGLHADTLVRIAPERKRLVVTRTPCQPRPPP